MARSALPRHIGSKNVFAQRTSPLSARKLRLLRLVLTAISAARSALVLREAQFLPTAEGRSGRNPTTAPRAVGALPVGEWPLLYPLPRVQLIFEHIFTALAISHHVQVRCG